jgi:hypothetical protein
MAQLPQVRAVMSFTAVPAPLSLDILLRPALFLSHRAALSLYHTRTGLSVLPSQCCLLSISLFITQHSPWLIDR